MSLKIPTFLSSESANTGSTGPFATRGAFDKSGALANIASGLSSVGDAARQVVNVVNQRRAQRQGADAQLFASRESTKAGLAVSKWMSDPANYSKDSFLEDFEKFVGEERERSLTSAPNEQAKKMIQLQYDDLLLSRGRQAVETSVRVGLENRRVGLTEQAGQIIQTFKNDMRSASSAEAGAHLGRAVEQFHRDSDAAFGDVSKELATSFKHDMAAEAILASAAESPQLAESLLDKYSSLFNQREIKSFKAQIKDVSESARESERYAFEQTRRDRLASAQSGSVPQPLDISAYEAFYSPAKAKEIKRQDDSDLSVFTRTAESFDKIRMIPPDQRQDQLSKLQSQIKTEEDAKVFDGIIKAHRRDQDLYESDKVSWAVNNIPEINGLYNQLTKADPEERGFFYSQLNQALLKYQGAAPEDASKETARSYMNLPTLSRSLMTKQQAEEDAGFINNGSPSQVMDRLASIMDKYPDPGHAAIAIQNLIRLPRHGIRQEYQLALQNSRNPYLASYLQAIDQSAAIKTLTDADQGKLTEALRSNTDWLSFVSTMTNGDLQRASELEGFQHGILAYARGMMANGKVDLETAVKTSVDRMITRNVGFIDYNGERKAVSLERPDGTVRSLDQINRFGDDLKVLAGSIDVDQVSPGIFVGLENLDGDRDLVRRVVSNTISERGDWVPSDDGESVILHLIDDGGQAIEVTDIKGRPIQVFLDDISVYADSAINPSVGTAQSRFFNLPAFVTPPRLQTTGPLPSTSNVPLKRRR